MSGGRQNKWGRVVRGEDEQGTVGGGNDEWWEAKPSKGDEWGEVAGGKRQNPAGEGRGS